MCKLIGGALEECDSRKTIKTDLMTVNGKYEGMQGAAIGPAENG